MAADLKQLPQQEPDAEVINAARDLLARAGSGELRGFVLAGVCDYPANPGNTVVWRSGQQKRAEMVIALERAKLRLMGFVEDIDIGIAL